MAGLYVHVPFCPSICPFCGFAVRLDRTDKRAEYLKDLATEAELAAANWDFGKLESIYVGGGTPSCLTVGEVGQLFKLVRSNFEIAVGAEITWEVNPEHAQPEYMAALTEVGVNRISLGVQSFDDRTLRVLGRKHRAKEAERAVEVVAKEFTNYNLDLILGAPHFDQVAIGQNAFQSSLIKLIAFKPPHVSIYALELEAETPFGRSARIRQWYQYQQDNYAKDLLWAISMLKQGGWQHYELSNFARIGRQSKQNLLIWQLGDYLGLGPSAHSHLAKKRWANHRALPDWQKALAQKKLPVAWQEERDSSQIANEALMMALRQPNGIDIDRWQQQFQTVWTAKQEQACQRWIKLRLAIKHKERLALTPKGLLLADAITAQLML